jgi:hypothetical protein
LALLLAASLAHAQQWAVDMFDHTSHDFGTVARGAKVEHAFTVENIYEEDAEISEIRSTCGCTNTKISQRQLKTWEKAQITAVVDTRAYLGQKDATLTVVFAKPFPAEVRLNIHTYIRSDVVVQPGAVQFGSVSQGSPSTQKVRVDYAGRPDWRITGVESGNSHLSARAVETSRADGQVTYDLVVELAADAPAGYLHDHLVLVTNDDNPRAARVPVPVEGVVASAVTVRPSPLLLGVVHAGKPVAAKCNDKRFHCQVPQEAKPVQVVPVTFVSDEASGRVTGTIYLETDQGAPEQLSVEARVQVVP